MAHNYPLLMKSINCEKVALVSIDSVPHMKLASKIFLQFHHILLFLLMTISDMLPIHATNNMYGGSTTKIGHCIEANPLVFHDTSFYMPKVMYCQMRF